MKVDRLTQFSKLSLVALLLFGMLAVPQRSVMAAPNTPVNGDFEQGRGVGWQESTTSGTDVVWDTVLYPGLPAHSGTWMAFLGGLASETETITQSVTIAPNTKMDFWYWLISVDSCGSSVARVRFNSIVVKSWTLCTTNRTLNWTRMTLDLSAYAGQTGNLQFYVNTTSTNHSSLLIDDVIFYDTFVDVSITDPFLPYIKALYNEGITSGCTTTPLMYCPGNPVTRGQMAVFIERALGNASPNPNPTNMFSDVPNDAFKPFIEELYNDGITTGCATNPLRYCPNNSVNRGEMAVFLERAMGNTAPNPNPTNMFSDVLLGNPFKPFIEELYNDGITSGCTTNPLRYCPGSPVTRGQMAVFLVKAFNIPLP